MAQFGVDLAKLRAALADLQKERGNLSTKIDEFQASEKTLSGKWEGDAKDSFEKAFNDDVKKMDLFIQAVQKYEKVLQDTIAAYEKAESANITTGKQRTR